jgi:hypothetical protein
MKNMFLIMVLMALSACASNSLNTKKDVVLVDKPLPYCPAPPQVNECVSMVDALTPADANDPGKVAQAYKYDMMCYRSSNKTLRQVLQQYENVSKNNSAIELLYKNLKQHYDEVLNSTSQTPAKP